MTTPTATIAEPAYPPLTIRGVPPEKVWRLYGAGNYPYFLRMIEQISNDFCPFCQIDRNLNKEIEINNPSWRAWNNPISKLPHQDYQFVIPLRRHATHHSDLTREERSDLFDVFVALDDMFGIQGGAALARWGNPLRCARTQEHFHFNYHVPNGQGDVHPWIAKDPAGLERKKRILEVFEKMRLFQEEVGCSVEEAHASLFTDERDLVANLLTTEGRC